MTRYDDRYDEFGYEREDYDGTLELKLLFIPRAKTRVFSRGNAEVSSFFP